MFYPSESVSLIVVLVQASVTASTERRLSIIYGTKTSSFIKISRNRGDQLIFDCSQKSYFSWRTSIFIIVGVDTFQTSSQIWYSLTQINVSIKKEHHCIQRLRHCISRMCSKPHWLSIEIDTLNSVNFHLLVLNLTTNHWAQKIHCEKQEESRAPDLHLQYIVPHFQSWALILHRT